MCCDDGPVEFWVVISGGLRLGGAARSAKALNQDANARANHGEVVRVVPQRPPCADARFVDPCLVAHCPLPSSPSGYRWCGKNSTVSRNNLSTGFRRPADKRRLRGGVGGEARGLQVGPFAYDYSEDFGPTAQRDDL